MGIYLCKPTNGVSYGVKYVVLAADVTDSEVIIDFQVEDYVLAATVLVTTSAGINKPLVDAVITYPANGQISIADGAATFALVAGDIISVIANRDYTSTL